MKSVVFNVILVLSIVFIILTYPHIVQNIPFLLTQFFGALLILWALLAKRLYKSPKPDKIPKSVFFLSYGPYEIIRHPIYAGILLIMAGFVQEYFTLPRFLVFVVLTAVILVKMKMDEQLVETFFKQDYISYKQKVHKLIPYLY